LTLLQDGELEGAPPGRADAENVVRLSGDPEVARTLGGVRSPVQSLVRLEHWLDVWRAHGFGPWVFHRHGTFIGYAGLGPAKATSEGEIELLYALLPEAWGKGLATRMGRLVVEHAFGPLDLTQLVAYTLPTNRGSRRVMEKLGFEYERDITHAGLPHVLYRLRRRVY
jgi:RimJ/RimL family protein N-acetyltransferase